MVTEIHVHPRRSGAISNPVFSGTAAATQPGYATGPATGMQYPLMAPTTGASVPVASGVTQPTGATVLQGGGVGVPPATVVQGAQAQAPLAGGLGTSVIDATGLGVAAPAATIAPGVANTGVVGSAVPTSTVGGTGTIGVAAPMTAADTTGVGTASTNVTVVPPPPTTVVGGTGTGGVGAVDSGIGTVVGVPTAQPVVTTGTVAGGVGAPVVGGISASGSGMVGGYGTGMGAGYGTGLGTAGASTMGIGTAGIGAGVRPPASQRLAGGLQQLGGYLADDSEMTLRGQARRTGVAPAPLTAQGAAIRGGVTGSQGVMPPGGGGTGRYVPGPGPTYHQGAST